MAAPSLHGPSRQRIQEAPGWRTRGRTLEQRLGRSSLVPFTRPITSPVPGQQQRHLHAGPHRVNTAGRPAACRPPMVLRLQCLEPWATVGRPLSIPRWPQLSQSTGESESSGGAQGLPMMVDLQCLALSKQKSCRGGADMAGLMIRVTTQPSAQRQNAAMSRPICCIRIIFVPINDIRILKTGKRVSFYLFLQKNKHFLMTPRHSSIQVLTRPDPV